MTSRPALAVSLYLQDRFILLVGEGPGADERAQRLSHAGAKLLRATSTSWHEHEHTDFFAVFAQSESDSVNLAVATWARHKGIWSYAHDQPTVSDFAFPALAKRGPLQVAISTEGVSPALAARLRVEIQGLLDASGEELDELLAELQHLRASLPSGIERMQLLKDRAAKVRLVGKIETKS